MTSQKLRRLQATILAITLVLCLAFAAQSRSQRHQSRSQRPMTVDDFLRFEDIAETALSPDSEWLAYVVLRSRASHVAQPYIHPYVKDRGDIWLFPVRGGKSRRLTNGTEDSSSYFAPQWSPDGRRLAMLSTKGGDLRLWLWERDSDQVKPLTDRNVGDGLLGLSSPTWISNNQIVCCVLAEGHRPREMTVQRGAPPIAMRAWTTAWSGRQSTASVLESGVPITAAQRPQRELRVIDVDSGSHRVIASGDVIFPSVSPDKRHVAFARFVGDSGLDRDKTPVNQVRCRGYKLLVARIDGEIVVPAVSEINHIDPYRYVPVWSPDGSELAIVGKTSSHTQGRAIVFRINLTSRSVHPATTEDLDPSGIAWSPSGHLLVRATSSVKERAPAESRTNRADWWLIVDRVRYRNLTEKLKSPPVRLELDISGNQLIGISDGEIWRIDQDVQSSVSLTDQFKPSIGSLVWRSQPTDASSNKLIVHALNGGEEQLYRLDLSSGSGSLLPKPAPTATLTSYNPTTNTAAFIARDQFGCGYLYLAYREGAKPTLVAETSTYLREIAQPELRKFAYRGLDGKTRTAWVLLPVGYEPDRQYPLVTFVNPETIHGEKPPTFLTVDTYLTFFPFCLPLLAARGYAVLFPSGGISSPYGKPGNPYFDLPNGVLPAVDKVIEMGIADPERIGLMGHSFGGFAVYGLVTQTNRFKGAVAIAGITDLVSIYGTLEAEFRYQDSYQYPYLLVTAEAGQLRMGTPPWVNRDRYIRNSPVSYVDRVETPLMMIHGDMDTVPLQQAEEFFTALERQNKRAQLVRYWGEGHDPQSPANIRDMWQRIFDWFDELLKREPTSINSPATPRTSR